MHQPLETITETIGFDEQTRSLYDISALMDWEHTTPLGEFFRYWRGCPVTLRGIPPEAHFDPDSNMPASAARWISSVDVRPDNPMQYVIKQQLLETGSDAPDGLSGRRFSDIPNILHAAANAVEFLQCKHEKQPLYFEINQIINGKTRHFMRLMLPVESESQEVETIYYGIRVVQNERAKTVQQIEN